MNFIYLICLIVVATTQKISKKLELLDNQVQSLSDQAYDYYQKLHQIINYLSQEELGAFLCITGKRYLYGTFMRENHEPDYLKAYFYIKLSAQKFNNANCLYYLGILYNFKLTPHFTIHKNLENIQNKTHSEQSLFQFIKSMHLTHSQLYLYLSAVSSNVKAQMVLANLHKLGLSTKKNCTTAALYYLSIGQKVFVNQFELHSHYRDGSNYEKQLYLKQKKEESMNKQNQILMIQESLNLGQKGTLQIAKYYYYGIGGYLRDYKKAVKIFKTLQENGNLQAGTLLALCYLKGQGVQKNYKRAYQLFKQSGNNFGSYMASVMDYHNIGRSNNKTLAIQNILNISKKNAFAKSFIGAIIIKGQLFNKTFADGITLLQQASNEGNLMAKFIIGTIYLDGTQFHYNCEKGVGYLSSSLMNSDNWTDLIQYGKLGVERSKIGYSIIKYLELSLIGDNVGMINGLYLIKVYEQCLKWKNQNWNYERLYQDQIYKFLLKKNRFEKYSVLDILFSDYLQLISLKRLRTLLQTSHQINKQFKNYLQEKLLFICDLHSQSICKFMSYKKNQKNAKISQLQKIAHLNQDKLHIYQSRYLFGKYIQNLNKSLKAKAYYKQATGSQLISQLIWYFEGGQSIFSFFNDLFLYLSIIIIIIGISFVHRNMMLIKFHQKEKQNIISRLKQKQKQSQQQKSKQIDTNQLIKQQYNEQEQKEFVNTQERTYQAYQNKQWAIQKDIEQIQEKQFKDYSKNKSIEIYQEEIITKMHQQHHQD